MIFHGAFCDFPTVNSAVSRKFDKYYEKRMSLPKNFETFWKIDTVLDGPISYSHHSVDYTSSFISSSPHNCFIHNSTCVYDFEKSILCWTVLSLIHSVVWTAHTESSLIRAQLLFYMRLWFSQLNELWIYVCFNVRTEEFYMFSILYFKV